MTEQKNDKLAATKADELTEDQLDDVQGAGVAMPEAAPPESDVIIHDVRKQGKEQQE